MVRSISSAPAERYPIIKVNIKTTLRIFAIYEKYEQFVNFL